MGSGGICGWEVDKGIKLGGRSFAVAQDERKKVLCWPFFC